MNPRETQRPVVVSPSRQRLRDAVLKPQLLVLSPGTAATRAGVGPDRSSQADTLPTAYVEASSARLSTAAR